VVAWDLGESVGSEQVESVRRKAQHLRSMPAADRRALICLPREGIWDYSRVVDLAVLEPPGPNGSLPLAHYGQWYLERSRMMRLGTHFWASVPTQPPAAVARQLALLGHQASDLLALEPEQIRLMVYHAIAAGARGLLLRSRSRLDGSDLMSELRSKTLQRINQELEVIEPWAATGKHARELLEDHPSVRVSLLETDRSRLAIIIRGGADQQFVVGPVEEAPLSFEIPGVPSTYDVYQVGEDGLRRITQRRTSGVHVQLERSGLITTIVLTQDPLVVNFLARQTAELRQQQDELVGDIVAQMYSAVVQTHQQLLAKIPGPRLSAATLENQALNHARDQLQRFQQLVEGGGHERAYEFLRRGRQHLARARHQDWKLAARAFPAPVASPWCVSYFTLPDHYALGERLRGAAWGPNSLPGGDFENLSVLQSSGWKNVSAGSENLDTRVELSMENPHGGRTSLCLQCWPRAKDQVPRVIESPPLRITSTPVPVRRGQLVCIRGWVRMPEKIVGSPDGLLIYDSIGGRELAYRIQAAPDWREFSLYRIAPRRAAVTTTFALSGMGEVWLDDVTVHMLGMSTAQRELGNGGQTARRQ